MFIVQFVDLLVTVLIVAIFARVVLSWLPIGANNPVTPIVYQLTEPILAPIRRVVPRLGFIDITPMIAIFLLYFIRGVIHRAFG